MQPHPLARRSLFAALALAGLAGCDLAHADQKAFCASARSDYAKCASRPDWCIATGGSECVGSVEGANCSDCAPTQTVERATCVPKPSLAVDCPGKAPRIRDGVFNPMGAWDWDRLDRKILEPRQGQVLRGEDVAALNDHDRHMLCGPGAGGDWTGKLPCVLQWNGGIGRAQCVVDQGFCAASCATHVTSFQCIAKNLCSGVICP